MLYPKDGRGNKPNCGVLVVATVTHKPLSEVFAHMKAKYGKNGNWKGRTFDHQVINTIGELGGRLENVFHKDTMGVKRGSQFMKWVNEKAQKDSAYVVWTTGHVQIVKEGKVYDQSGCGTPIAEHWGRRKFIKRIEKVTPFDELIEDLNKGIA